MCWFRDLESVAMGSGMRGVWHLPHLVMGKA
jgi:hypothetical protein